MAYFVWCDIDETAFIYYATTEIVQMGSYLFITLKQQLLPITNYYCKLKKNVFSRRIRWDVIWFWEVCCAIWKLRIRYNEKRTFLVEHITVILLYKFERILELFEYQKIYISYGEFLIWYHRISSQNKVIIIHLEFYYVHINYV